MQAVLEALNAGAKGVSSAARRFRLRCLKAVVLLLADQPALDFDAAVTDPDADAMLGPEEKRQQVTLNCASLSSAAAYFDNPCCLVQSVLSC